MQLYMVRHGQSYVNLKEWSEGNKDTGLTELGHKQAAALGKWLPSEVKHIDAMYVSTMMRAQETAAYITKAYQGLTPIPEPRIREIGNNQLTKDPWPNDMLPEYGEYWGSERPFHSITPSHPGGESLMHFRIRIGEFLEELAEKHEKEIVVTVCHGGVIEMAFDHMFNIGPWRRAEVFTKNTGISRFDFGHTPHREFWRIYYHSRIDHLVGIDH